MQFSQKNDGFRQKDSQGFQNSYDSINKTNQRNFSFSPFYQNYTLALIRAHHCIVNMWGGGGGKERRKEGRTDERKKDKKKEERKKESKKERKKTQILQ